ncbi:MAG: LysM peptidoglycan-binding domain-containing protein [Anaerolineaceae bacterium]
MSEKESAQNVIDKYRKQQQAARKAPIIIIVAAVLLVIGAAALIFWALGSEAPSISLFPTKTYTPTITATATNTPTVTPLPTDTPTVTDTPTETLTPTASGPFAYTVVEGDTLSGIADKFEVDLMLLIAINNLDSANPIIKVGDQITIPGPDTEMPTATPLPANLHRGSKIEYTVQSGDSLASIALQFNSTVDSIKEENDITDANTIYVGQKLVVLVNLVTPVPTATPATPTITGIAPAATTPVAATATLAAGVTATP